VPAEVRDSVVLGHLVRVIHCAENAWRVMVDGEEISSAFANPHEAWAQGVAESYRQGSKERRSARYDADHESHEQPLV